MVEPYFQVLELRVVVAVAAATAAASAAAFIVIVVVVVIIIMIIIIIICDLSGPGLGCLSNGQSRPHMPPPPPLHFLLRLPDAQSP